ncbi:MAG: FGGY family carbohydrate kinase, partial [Verrucomicrobiota bacterium]|nr:FGGY family carbohydrate kinase [Verrucomicrobiota bacterium]
MKFVLALDQGTTSSRTILFDETGKALHSAQREFTQHYPQPGWVEHDADEIWASQGTTLAEVLSRSDRRSIAGLGISNQR